MNYVWMALCGVLGVVVYSLWKCYRINSKYENETFDSVVLIFLKKERFTSLISLGAIAICLIITGSMFRMRADGIPLPWAPVWLNELWPYFINIVFIGIGLVGGWVFISGLNLTDKYFQKKEKELGDKISQ